MKYFRSKLISSLVMTLGILAVCATSCEDMEEFDNKAFTSTAKLNNILLKGTNDTETMIIRTEIAKPENKDINVVYKVDESLVGEYNINYGEEALILPVECYEIPENVSTIVAGTVKGSDVEVVFKNLTTLNRDLTYLLPVSVAESNIDFLNSARTTYYVIKGAALINATANLTENNLSLQDPASSTLKDMEQITIEVLMNVSKFGKLVSTVMGIEGDFLFRIGDAGVPDNQLQLSCSNNVTDAAWQLSTNEWQHLAATYDSSTGEVNVYIDGVKKGATQVTSFRGSVDWASSNFYIGKSYDDARWLEGDVCEMRVWNRVLTADEINAKDHFYVVSPDSEGLEAYWKFDEGAGMVIKDHTGHGNTVVAKKELTWTAVSLPK